MADVRAASDKPAGDLFSDTISILSIGARAWWTGTSPWVTCLDAAAPAYGRELVNDVRQFLKVCTLLLPAPIFWSLFDQQSSRWTFQATHMDCRLLLGNGLVMEVQPEQIQALNAVLILLLLPFFDRVVYPTVAKVCSHKAAYHSVHRMAAEVGFAGRGRPEHRE